MKTGIFMGFIIFVFLIHSIFFGNTGIMEQEGVAAPVLLISVMTIILVFAITYKIHLDKKNENIKRWPYVTGRITEIKLKDSVLKEREIQISYSYLINDVDYRGSIFSLRNYNTTEGLLRMMPGMREIHDIYDLEGKMTRVYYNPKKPWDSVLCNKVDSNNYIVLFPSLVTISACLYFVSKIFFNMN